MSFTKIFWYLLGYNEKIYNCKYCKKDFTVYNDLKYTYCSQNCLMNDY